jgi:hypothetical protein
VDRGGKAMLEVYNPQNNDGSAAPQVVMFYDDTVTITLPYKGESVARGAAGIQ